MSAHIGSGLVGQSKVVDGSAGERVLQVLTTSVARGLFALPFLVFGLTHFAFADGMAGMVPVPGGVFWIYLTGAALVAGSIGILTRRLGTWAALGLALLMLTFALTVHVPGLANAASQQMSLIGLLKDTALAGGALAWAGIFRGAR